MANTFEDILLMLSETQEKGEVFRILNEKLADTESGSL